MASKSNKKGGGKNTRPSPARPVDAAPAASGSPSSPTGSIRSSETSYSASIGTSSRRTPPAGSSGDGWRPWPLPLLVVLLLAGIGFAFYLTRLHLDLFYGGGSMESLCNFGEGLSCSDVNASPYSELFGFLPLSLMALPVYSVMLMLTMLGSSLRDRRALGVVTVLGLLSTVFSVYLAYVSKVHIGSFCLFCVAMYAVNLSALILPMVATRSSLGTLVRSAFDIFQSTRLAGLAAINLVLVSALSWGAYSAAKQQFAAETAKKALEQVNRPAAQASAQPAAATKPVKRGPDQKVDVPIDDTVPFKGAKDAKVTIVSYEDFQCGFCKRLSGNLEGLLEKYPNDVRIGYRHFAMNLDCNAGGTVTRSMHPDACRAALASECARKQGKFWEYHDLLFKNFGSAKASDINAFAREIGLDEGAFQSCQSDPATLQKVRDDSITGGQLGISGTPTFFINGRQFSGAQSVEVMSAVVEAELKGQQISMAELREVAKAPNITGQVTAPEMVKLQGPYGEFEMDSVEASIVNGKAVSKPGAVATTSVTWFEADAACKAAGKRLCSEPEWVTACGGALPVDKNGNGLFNDDYATGTAFPYGEYYKEGLCNDQVEPPKGADPNNPPPPPPLVTGNHPQCKSKAGIFDLTGNAREWVGTVPSKSAFVGGAFFSRDDAACASRNESVGPAYEHEATGFRCCRGGNVPERVTHPGREVGEKLKAFTLPTIDGKTFSSDSLKGKVTLLTFWASWCGPCRKELPAYASIYPELEKKGFRIIAVNVDQEPEKAAAFLEKYPVNYPVIMDTDNSLFQSFDIKGNGTLPTAFMIDQKGVIVQRKSGYDDGDEKRLQRSVEKMLGIASAAAPSR